MSKRVRADGVLKSGSYAWREWFDVFRAVAPTVLPDAKAAELVKNLPEPVVGEVEHKVKYDQSKGKRILGIQYRTKEDTVRGILEQGVNDGWF